MTTMRLQVALAKAGVSSRRKAVGLIESGHVKVNGKVITERGFRVDTSKDKVIFNGKALTLAEKKYYILNKPCGVLSTVKDERGRKKVSDYIRGVGSRLYPVGRLDKDTTGLIILTNDGELTYRLTHPKFGVERLYEVKIDSLFRETDASRLKEGLVIDGKIARVDRVVIKKKNPDFSVIHVALHEGRKREVRKMFDHLRLNIKSLKRIAYGPLRLKDLREGESRPLTTAELRILKKSIDL